MKTVKELRTNCWILKTRSLPMYLYSSMLSVGVPVNIQVVFDMS